VGSKFIYIARKSFIRQAPATACRFGTFFDIEADGLLDTATKIHCIVITDLDSGQVEEFEPDQIEAGLARLSAARRLIGHNIANYDLPLLLRLYGWKPVNGCIITDTLVASRLILPHMLALDAEAMRRGDSSLGGLTGSHSLEAWGARLGFPKIGADIADWSEWTPEIQARCTNDILLNKRLFEFLQPDGQPPEALALEHDVAVVCDELTVTGIPFDKAAGKHRQQQWEATQRS
jgi:hypothetical protein